MITRALHEKLRHEKRTIERRLARAKGGMKPRSAGPELATRSVRFELSDRTRAISAGGLGAILERVADIGLAKRIDEGLPLLERHRPYHESDHVLNIAYNVLCGGRTLDDIELRRNDRVFLDALGARAIPDPTTAGDFCRRFSADDVWTLMRILNDARVEVWKRRGPALTDQVACIDADGVVVSTRTGSTAGLQVKLNVTAGDFNGDGRGDVVVLEKTYLSTASPFTAPLPSKANMINSPTMPGDTGSATTRHTNTPASHTAIISESWRARPTHL